ncbi:MBOAT family O-acyltransferase [uncultured Fibrella sp.]|uniref:MBOAT family O-acyltransferase n=1 Tax=uncultured Fibrella sp. TaxID=1284596 RepID=UPI0035CB6D3D
MLFNSLQFLLFFTIVTLGYYQLGWQGRWRLLLLASLYFYMVFKPAYILILGLTIVIDYIAGIWIERTSGSARRRLLIISLISNLGILAFFKYLGFFTENIAGLFDLLKLPHLADLLTTLSNQLFIKVLVAFGQSDITAFKDSVINILPIGLSFHTFQAMSYTIEVYRGNQKAERHFGLYALYVMFYPQLVAGPIERPQNVLPQFHQYFNYDFENVKAGLMQMAFGFFKKLVIADRLAMVVSNAYSHPEQHNGLTLLVATFFFTFQIYCDFSGYSDIAIGAARVMGFNLMENFRAPYFAQSISEFWRRWHMSLSTWFRDYLYIPLGGSRRGEERQYLNLFIVFLASGLWHGANWTYIIWGGLNGSYQIMAVLRDKGLARLGYISENSQSTTAVRVFTNRLTTFVLIMLTWVFFRAITVHDAFLILYRIATLSFSDPVVTSLNNIEMWFSVGLIGLLLVKEYYYQTIPTRHSIRFYLLMLLLLVTIYFFGVFTSNQFIYFQF